MTPSQSQQYQNAPETGTDDEIPQNSLHQHDQLVLQFTEACKRVMDGIPRQPNVEALTSSHPQCKKSLLYYPC